MGQNDSTPEVACTVTEQERAERSREIQSTLSDRYLGFEERPDGVTVRFEGAEETLRAVAAFAAAELQCCAFAEYGVSVSPPYEETALTITGPDGTKEMFREGLVARLQSGVSQSG